MDELPAVTEPYLTVGLDIHGSTCWKVVTTGMVINTPSGHYAVELLVAMRRSRGLPVP
jgi:hypothetical protein